MTVNGLMVFGNGQLVELILIGVSLLLFVLSLLLFLSWWERLHWHSEEPYEPPFYLIAPIIYEDDETVFIDSLGAALYGLIQGRNIKLIFSKEKAIMGDITKIKLKKLARPTEPVLQMVYDLIPDNLKQSGLFGDKVSGEIDVDDLYTFFSKQEGELILADYKNLAISRYRELYGKEKKDIRLLSYGVGAFSVLWAILMFVYFLMLKGFNTYILILASLLLVVGILLFKIKVVWGKVAKHFRSRWLAFKRRVVDGNIEISDFYTLLGYAIALGIPHRYLDVAKKQIVEGKLTIGKARFFDAAQVSFSELRNMVDMINMLTGALGRKE